MERLKNQEEHGGSLKIDWISPQGKKKVTNNRWHRMSGRVKLKQLC